MNEGLSLIITQYADEAIANGEMEKAANLYAAASELVIEQETTQISVLKDHIKDLQKQLIEGIKEEDLPHYMHSFRASYFELQAKMGELIRPAGYYNAIEKAIHGDEMLQSAWQEFIVILKLRCDPIPGLTY